MISTLLGGALRFGRLLPALPIIAALPLAPWFVRRIVDDGASLSFFAAFTGAFLIALAVIRKPAPIGGSRIALAISVVIAVAATLLQVRAGLMASAFLATGALLSSRCSARAVFPGAALLALACVHPADVDAILGWPLRALLAHGAANLLSAFGSEPIAAETVMVIEGRVADVELACAGTKSLTVLAIAFAAIVALRQQGRVLPSAAVVVVVFVALSMIRVAVLAGVTIIVDAPRIAEMLHVPLGLLAFAGALVAGVIVMRPDDAPVARPTEPTIPAALVALVILMGNVSSRAQSPPADGINGRVFDLAGTPAMLTDSEARLFSQLGASAAKTRLDDGTTILVVLGSWRAHHSPERCLAAAGLRIASATTMTIDGIPTRKLRLSSSNEEYVGLSAFVSRDRVVASALERALRESVLRDGPWVFISLLAPTPAAGPGTIEAHFIDQIQRAQHSLSSRTP